MLIIKKMDLPAGQIPSRIYEKRGVLVIILPDEC